MTIAPAKPPHLDQLQFIENFCKGAEKGTKRDLYFLGKRYFKNSHKLPFHKVVCLVCSILLGSYQRELINSSNIELGHEGLASSSAFSQARQGINPKFFQQLHESLVDYIYQNQPSPQLFKGVGLTLVDGYTLVVPDTDDCRKVFGTVNNQFSKVPMARAAILSDGLSGYILAGEIGPYKMSEKALFSAIMKRIPKGNIAVGDRNFASLEHAYRLMDAGNSYVFRCKATHNADIEKFAKSGAMEAIITSKISWKAVKRLQESRFNVKKGEPFTYRVVRVSAEGQEDKFLITNLLEEDGFTIADLGEIYRLRWGVEIAIDKLKNKQLLEYWSGTLSSCVKQDFFGNFVLYNFSQSLENYAQEVYDSKEKAAVEAGKKPTKHEQKINTQQAVVAASHILIHYQKDKKNIEKFIDAQLEALIRFTVPIRPNRNVPRSKRKKSLNLYDKRKKNTKKAS